MSDNIGTLCIVRLTCKTEKIWHSSAVAFEFHAGKSNSNSTSQGTKDGGEKSFYKKKWWRSPNHFIHFNTHFSPLVSNGALQ